MMRREKDETINIKSIFNRLVSNYVYFLVSILLFSGAAFGLYKLLPPKYEATTTLQLKDQSLVSKGTTKEKFIAGLELLDGDAEFEDEIGILSSYSMVEKALSDLDFTVSCFSYSNDLGIISKKMEEEIYHEKIFVTIDKNKPQLIDQPIYITFKDNGRFTLEADVDKGSLYDLKDQKFTSKDIRILVNEEGKTGEWINTPYFTFRVATDSSLTYSTAERYFFVIQNMESLTKEYTNKINITPISKESNIVKITTQGRVPQKEIDFLNSLTQNYIRNDLNKKGQLGIQTIAFIDSQLDLIYDSLSEAERNLKTFRSSDHIIDISTTAQNLNQQLQELEKQRAELRVQHDFFDYTRAYVQKNSDENIEIVAPSSVGINDPFLNNLLIQLADLYREKIDKSYSSKSNSPVTQLIESKISNTKKAILDNIEGLISANAIGLNENATRIQSIQNKIQHLPESERNLININRKFALNDNIYNYLLEKRAEAGIALASNYPDKSVIDPARLTSKKPVSPKLMLFLLAAIFIGLAFPIAGIVVSDFLSNKVRNKREVEQLTDLKVIGIISTFPKPHNKISLEGNLPFIPPTETFKFLVINLKQLYDLNENKVIGFSSSQQGDGKTFCAVNTASMFALTGKRTLYVDADLFKNHQQSISKEDTKQNADLTDYLITETATQPVIRSTATKNLFILPAGRFDKNNKGLVHASEQKLDYLFQQLRNKFDLIIVDTPPLTMMADYFTLSKYFDINLLVVRYNSTDRRLLEEAVPMVKLRPLKNPGLIFNDVRISKLKNYGLTYYYK